MRMHCKMVRELKTWGVSFENAHMEEHSPSEGDGELPSFTFDWRLDMLWRKIIREVYVKLDIFEVRRIVDHV